MKIQTSWNGGKFRFYDTGTDHSSGADYDVAVQNMQSELAKGYSFVNINTHGGPTAWQMEVGSNFTNQNACAFQNANRSIIVTEACYSNRLSAYDPCLGEKFMENTHGGILAYYGCTDFAYGNAYGLLGPIDRLNGSLFNNIFTSCPAIFGRAVNESKNVFMSNWYTYSVERCHHLFMLALCDPEMHIFTRIPEYFDNLSLSHYGNNFTISYNNENRFDCCVMSRLDKGESFYKFQKDCISSFSMSNLQGEYMICVTSMDLIPYRTIWGSTVYLQNELLDGNLNVTADNTVIGSNVVSGRDQGPVVVENGSSVISSRYGVTINGDFEVKSGAALEITAN